MDLKEKLQENVSRFKESSIHFVEKTCEERSKKGYTEVKFDMPFYSEKLITYFREKGLDVKISKHPAYTDEIIGFVLSW